MCIYRHAKNAEATIFQPKKQVYVKHSNIFQSEGEELGMWRHVEDAKGGRDCGHNENPQKQPGKRLVYKKRFFAISEEEKISFTLSLLKRDNTLIAAMQNLFFTCR